MNWSREIKYANTIAKDTTYQYLGIGWGDKEFYMNTPTWSQLKLSVAFKAVFGLGEAVMHTTYYKEMAENEDCRRIVISDEQYSQLIRYVTDGFKKDTNGHFINIPTNMTYGYSDAFYEANGHYNLFFTCNTWVNNALKVSGQKCCLWAVFDTEIFLKYR